MLLVPLVQELSWGEISEGLVGSAVYLACDDSRLATGIQLFVDGGNSMR